MWFIKIWNKKRNYKRKREKRGRTLLLSYIKWHFGIHKNSKFNLFTKQTGRIYGNISYFLIIISVWVVCSCLRHLHPFLLYQSKKLSGEGILMLQMVKKIPDIAKFESNSPALPNIARVIETGGNIIGIARELHETMR